MKINEITEMTMRGPDYTELADKLAATNAEKWLADGKYIADIEHFRVLKNSSDLVASAEHYSLWDGDTLAAFALLENESTVDGVWVAPEYRGQRLFSKLLWFFKTRLNRSPLILGDIHSTTMQEVVKGLSRFNKSWINIRTNEVEPFSLDTLDKYYSYSKPTAWRLMLENDGEFNNWPMFNGSMLYLKEDYTEITK